MLDVIASSATLRAKDHMRQLDAELADVPQIDERRALEIRGLLREMSKLDREAFITRADDPEILAAMVHGPKSFPLAGEETVSHALRNFNRAHRPDRVALRDDNETYITAIENFRDMVGRQLRAALR